MSNEVSQEDSKGISQEDSKEGISQEDSKGISQEVSQEDSKEDSSQEDSKENNRRLATRLVSEEYDRQEDISTDDAESESDNDADLLEGPVERIATRRARSSVETGDSTLVLRRTYGQRRVVIREPAIDNRLEAKEPRRLDGILEAPRSPISPIIIEPAPSVPWRIRRRDSPHYAGDVPCPLAGTDEEAKTIMAVCVICGINQIQTVNFPCRHACFCLGCARPAVMHSNVCPICRLVYERIDQLYLSYTVHEPDLKRQKI